MDAAVLQAALQGLERQRTEVENRIATVRAMLGARKLKAGVAPGAAKPRRVLNRAARKRISEAQKRRWALVRAKAGARVGKKAGNSAGAA